MRRSAKPRDSRSWSEMENLLAVVDWAETATFCGYAEVVRSRSVEAGSGHEIAPRNSIAHAS